MEIFDCDNISKFIDSFVSILPLKGISDSLFAICEVKRGDKKVRFLVKFYHHKKTPLEQITDYKGINSSDAEIAIMKEFKKTFIDTNITPNIIEMLYYKKCNNIESLASDSVCEDPSTHAMIKSSEDETELVHTFGNFFYNRICDLIIKKRVGLVGDNYYFAIIEQMNEALSDYISDNAISAGGVFIPILKTILFEIIYTLREIEKKYPKFKHGDLHPQNILLLNDPNYKFDPNNIKYIVYASKSNTPYYVPYYGIVPKIIDFGHSALPEINVVSPASMSLRQKYINVANDTTYLLWYIYKMFNANQEIVNLIKSIYHNNMFVFLRDASQMRRFANRQLSTEILLDNNIWDEYKIQREDYQVIKKFD